jgi:hypothetical protein
MLNNLTILQQEITTLQARQGELRAEYQQVLNELSAARTAIVEGTGSTEALTAKQAAETGLAGACDHLTRRIEAKKYELEAAHAAKIRAEELARIAAVGSEIKNYVADLDRETAEGLQQFDKHVQTAAALVASIVQKQVELSNLMRQARDVPDVLNADGQAIAVRELLELSYGTMVLTMEGQPAFSPFGQFFVSALQHSFNLTRLNRIAGTHGARARQSVQDEREYQNRHSAQNKAA